MMAGISWRLKYRERCKPRTQEQADAWAVELDGYRNGHYGRIQTQQQAEIVTQELDNWLERNK